MEMKSPKYDAWARLISRESHAFVNYDQLPKSANAKRQINALKLDKKWMKVHYGQICRRMDALIDDIEQNVARKKSRQR
jgi:hypothetical protein